MRIVIFESEYDPLRAGLRAETFIVNYSTGEIVAYSIDGYDPGDIDRSDLVGQQAYPFIANGFRILDGVELELAMRWAEDKFNLAESEAPTACEWRHIALDECWQTRCDNAFYLESGTPAENHMKFCPYCGRRLTATEEPCPTTQS